jgi:hypothetical protein
MSDLGAIRRNGVEVRVTGALPPYRRSIRVGHHSRPECLEREGEWCRGIGRHPGRCASCPSRRWDAEVDRRG